ncbi:MAG: flagellar motor switch protein FliM [Proteobacteria bacterium]|nr:flagellar motor switch protein FliM [Pseudomonadota bacterium]MDE3208325.1 flagellar motor switch protein FliM [Pseudomonadota bacterium]
MSEILSQDEIDALLKGVTGEADEPSGETGAVGIQAYNFAKQERIVRGRMPTLEIINERFARQFRIGLFNFMRRNAEISVGPVKVVKYSEFIRNLIVPTNMNIVQVKPLRGSALFIFDPNFVFLVVDNLFGGNGQFHMRVEGRDFTPTEQRIIQNMLRVAFNEMELAWKAVYPVQFEYVRSEMNTQFANIASPTEVVVVTTFNIELGNGGGDFHVCLPYAMIEPIRTLLISTTQGDRMESDDRWLGLLRSQVRLAEVELCASLGHAELTLADVLEMKAGDLIMVDIPRSITATVDDVPVLECSYGVRNGRYALKVEKVIDPALQKLGQGEPGG